VAPKPNLGVGRLVAKVTRKTHTHTHTHAVELLWTKDEPDAESTTYTTHIKHKLRKSKLSAGFEPAIFAIQRVYTYALDRTASGIGRSKWISLLSEK
jgi:hypothetical protein